MSRFTTVAAYFDLAVIPDEKDIALPVKNGPIQMALDVLKLNGGTNATIQVKATELVESYREVEITGASSTFTAGRMLRGDRSGLFAVSLGTRTAGGVTYLRFSGPRSNFQIGEIVREHGITTTDVPDSAATATIQAQASDVYIVGDEVADTTAVDGDKVVLINPAKSDQPLPANPRRVRLSYVFSGAPNAVSFIVRVG
ncbi:hypothetical protein [Candidatus Rariloculus sp.]|uniref:hypothetical protein n=1 Tax=Candidatus Rariloculus sp. TaxID=3101265 RepID=UPI003D118DEB